MENNIISQLVKQHRVLQKSIDLIETLSNEVGETNIVQIRQYLEKFTVDLVEHLSLENEEYYIELIQKMKEQNQNTKKTEEFIREMKKIESTVHDFLNKYSTNESIIDNFESFKEELGEIKETLILRIETEEAGIYSYWGLF